MASIPQPNQISVARQRVIALQTTGVRDCSRGVLLAMLDFLPPPGLNSITNEICACESNDELKELARHYITSVFKPLKAAGGNTPRPSPSPNSEADAEANEVEETLGTSQLRLSTRAVERICLPRDAYRCMVTRLRSAKTPENSLPPHFDHALLTPTESCHIIPLSMAQYGPSDQARHDASRTWSSLCRMFPGLRHRILDHLENINNPSNILTLSAVVHTAFGNFDLAFEQLPGQNRYQVRYWRNVALILPYIQHDGIVQFTNNSSADTPLPDPYLLQVHLIVAQILNASGLAKVLEETFDRYDSLGCLANDGSTNLPFVIEVP